MKWLSDKPFGDALRALMAERSFSYRALAKATCQIDGRGMTAAHINMLANGHDRPSMRAMELIAQACDVGPIDTDGVTATLPAQSWNLIRLTPTSK